MPSTTTNTAVKIQAVLTRPTPRVVLIQSAKLSPTVVHSTLITQNQMVTSGTLFSSRRPSDVRVSTMVAMRPPCLATPALCLTATGSGCGEDHLDVALSVGDGSHLKAGGGRDAAHDRQPQS